MPAKRPVSLKRQLQLRISLLDVVPLVWRSIRVPETITLPNLHHAIQSSMGWLDCHLHEFRTPTGNYGNTEPDDSFDDDLKPEQRVRLIKALAFSRSFEYIYDYGDNWRHLVQIEDIIDHPGEADAAIRCVGGANACPPEDVGGVSGYQDFLQALSDPDHEEHEQLREWIGRDFLPWAFDITAVNARLARLRG